MEWLLTLKIPANVPWFAREKRLFLNIKENIVSTAGHSKLLGVATDSKLTFNKHIKMLCPKVNQKVSAFARLNNYIFGEQALIVCNATI